jgi:Putative Actinobacterial Holin-X, holin superfamily III
MGTVPTFQTEFEELGRDLEGFIETRYEMLRAELSAGLIRMRNAAVLIVAAVVIAIPALIMLGICISLTIGLCFGAFQNQVGLIWGFFLSGAGSLLIAAILGATGKARLKATDLIPNPSTSLNSRQNASARGSAATSPTFAMDSRTASASATSLKLASAPAPEPYTAQPPSLPQ